MNYIGRFQSKIVVSSLSFHHLEMTLAVADALRPNKANQTNWKLLTVLLLLIVTLLNWNFIINHSWLRGTGSASQCNLLRDTQHSEDASISVQCQR